MKEFNDLPDALFVNVGFDEGMFGVGADAAYVCPDHLGRALPCRKCMYDVPATTPYVRWDVWRAELLLEAFKLQGYAYVSEFNLQKIVMFLSEKGW